MGTRVALQNGGAQDQDYVALYSAGRVRSLARGVAFKTKQSISW